MFKLNRLGDCPVTVTTILSNLANLVLFTTLHVITAVVMSLARLPAATTRLDTHWRLAGSIAHRVSTTTGQGVSLDGRHIAPFTSLSAFGLALACTVDALAGAAIGLAFLSTGLASFTT